MNPHIQLISQFNERLESIDANRARILEILNDEPNVLQIPILEQAAHRLNAIEAEIELAMIAIRSQN